MLNTIKLPRNIRMLQGKLPKNNMDVRKSTEKSPRQKPEVTKNFKMKASSRRHSPPRSGSQDQNAIPIEEIKNKKTHYHYKANPAIPRPPKK